jgi:hypothetical protein
VFQGDDLSIFEGRVVSVGIIPKLVTMGWLRVAVEDSI